MRIAFIYTTVASVSDAETLANKAIKAKLAACINIFPGLTSVYEWKGVVEKNQEVSLLFKTSVEKEIKLKEWIEENHPYTIPAIVTLHGDASKKFYEYVKSTLQRSENPLN